MKAATTTRLDIDAIRCRLMANADLLNTRQHSIVMGLLEEAEARLDAPPPATDEEVFRVFQKAEAAFAGGNISHFSWADRAGALAVAKRVREERVPSPKASVASPTPSADAPSSKASSDGAAKPWPMGEATVGRSTVKWTCVDGTFQVSVDFGDGQDPALWTTCTPAEFGAMFASLHERLQEPPVDVAPEPPKDSVSWPLRLRQVKVTGVEDSAFTFTDSDSDIVVVTHIAESMGECARWFAGRLHRDFRVTLECLPAVAP